MNSEDEVNFIPFTAEGRRTLIILSHVEFKENNTAHYHRYMMYHLDKHNQVNSENISQPFIFRECRRLFCDSHSLMIHNIIHLNWAGKTFLEEDLNNTKAEDSQCLQTITPTSSSSQPSYSGNWTDSSL